MFSYLIKRMAFANGPKIKLKHYIKVKKWLLEKAKKAEQNTVDIPEFLKPKEEQRGYLCKKYIVECIHNNPKTFWEMYDLAQQH